jgi:tetratricopeptide (TPR) repeat protein
MPPPDTRVLFEDREILVLHRPGRSDHTLVTFADLTFRPAGHAFWGRDAAEKLGQDAIGFVAKRENWYPVVSVRAAAPRVRAALKPRSIAYGYSMGAYGALKHGALLGVTSALAVAPQASIAPAEVPRDTRFHGFHRPGLHQEMRIAAADLAPVATVLADPYDALDWQHATMIAAAGPAQLLRAPLAGHAAIWLLAGSDALAEMLEPALAGDIAAMRAVLRGRRSRSGHWFRIMGRAALRRGHPRLAETLWDRAGALGIAAPVIAAERADAMADRAQCLAEAGRLPEAAAVSRALIAAAPGAAVPVGRAAHLLLAAAPPAEAEDAFRRALALRPAAADLEIGLSLALAAQGRPREALEAARAAHAANPADVALATHYAHLLNAAGRAQRPEAERIFRAIVARQPGAGLALYGLAGVVADRGDLAQALALALRAVARLPGHAESLALLARLALRVGQVPRAERLFRRLQRDFPARPEAWLGLADALEAQGRRGEAVGALRRGLARLPGDAALQARLRALTAPPSLPARLAARLRGMLGRRGPGGAPG